MHVRDIIQNQERLCTSGQLEHNKRNFISASNHVFFVYHINTKALYWQEKSPLLMNENKRIDNPWIRVVKCVDALKMKTCLEWLQKQTVGPIFNIKKFTVNYGSVTKNWCIKEIYFLWGYYCRKDATWTQITTAAPVRLIDN